MQNNFKNEILDYIKSNNMDDIFTNENTFFSLYGCNLFIYLRVSTERQDFGRQLVELCEWAKNKNITIFIDSIFFDKYTGKSLKRDGYQEMKKRLKNGDYLVTSNLSRLGRNWDDIKKEWNQLEYDNIKRIIIDNANLCVELPNEKVLEMTLSRKMMQDITFSALLYGACLKLQEVSETTKDGLKKAKLQGKKIGRPTSEYNTKENFIKTLEKMINENIGQQKAVLLTKYPPIAFKKAIKEYYQKYNTKDYKKILKKLKEEE